MPLVRTTDCGGFPGLGFRAPEQQSVSLAKLQRLKRRAQGGFKKARQERKALYQSKLADQNLQSAVGKDVHDSILANPRQLGLPRSYHLKVADPRAMKGSLMLPQRDDHDAWMQEGHTVFFSAFGIPGRRVKFNGAWIEPNQIQLSPDAMVYNISTTDSDGNPLGLYLDCSHPSAPTGLIQTREGTHRVGLEPFATAFNVNVTPAEDAGAYYDTADRKFMWDETSDKWKNADWSANNMIFSYDTANVKTNPVNEVSFQDPQDLDHAFQLRKKQFPSVYSCTVDSDTSSDCFLMTVIVSDPKTNVPQPIGARAVEKVTSVYPWKSQWKFDAFGDSFTGMYMLPDDKNTMYAVAGSGQDTGRDKKLSFKTSAEPHRADGFDNTSGRSILELFNYNPMRHDPKTQNFVDSVSNFADADFHDIICYYMDDDIRTAFFQPEPVVLTDATVKQIATDNPENQEFYKTLQVPYVTNILAGATDLPESKQCNGIRAQKQLQDIPANSPVYKRHSDALYRYRFLNLFPSLQWFLDDQANTDYSVHMQKAADWLKKNLQSGSQGVSDPDAVAAAMAEIDGLLKWATDNKLYWAFHLYYYVQKHWIAPLYSQFLDGELSARVSMKIKQVNAVFGMLEGPKTNPNGKTFQQAFNELLMIFQMTSIIPQLVDPTAISSDYDKLFRMILQQFCNDAQPNQDIVDQVGFAQRLLDNDEAREGLQRALIAATRESAAMSSWAATMEYFHAEVADQTWFEALEKGSEICDFGATIYCVIAIFSGSSGASWGDLSGKDQWEIIEPCVHLAIDIIVKVVQGAIRVTVFWQNVAGWYDKFKLFLGAKDLVAEMPAAMQKTTNTLARWFIETDIEIQAQGPAESVWGKIFGRNVGEFLTNCVGAILAGISLVLTAIDLENTTDPLQRNMDIMMIVSGGLQLLAIGANWFATTGLVAPNTCEVLAYTSSVLGALATIFAIAGIIIMICMLFRKPPSPAQDFLDKHAAPVGLKMPYGADIDYMNPIPSDANSLSCNGIYFTATKFSQFKEEFAYLRMGAPDGSNYTATTTQVVTLLSDTCFSVRTDSTGISQVYTFVSDAQGLAYPVFLAATDANTVEFATEPAKVDPKGEPIDPTVYTKQINQQQWIFSFTPPPTNVTRQVDGKTVTFLQSGAFDLTNVYTKTKLLAHSSNGAWSVTLGSPTSGDDIALWTLTLDSMGPPDFTYAQQSWELSTNSRDEQNTPMLQGLSTDPLTWSVSPPLPSWLQLIGNGAEAGRVVQVPGVAPPVTPASTYTVTASVTITLETLRQSTSFAVTVISAPGDKK